MRTLSAFLCLLSLIGICLGNAAVGLAWSDWDSDNLGALVGGGYKTSWIYTWSPWNTKQGDAAHIELVPMLWGGGAHIADFMNAQNDGVFNSVSHILGFNEPDQGGQANLDPNTAAGLWKQYLQPLSGKGKRLGAPATASNAAGKAWLQRFFSACSGCTIDFIPLHWYGSNHDSFTSYVTDMHNTFGRNVWITEWACVPYDPQPCDQGSVNNLMNSTVSWLDSQPWVERYAWFGAMRNLGGVPATNALLTSDGQSHTALGLQYAQGR